MSQNQVQTESAWTVQVWVIVLISSVFVVVCSGLWAYILVTRTNVQALATPTVVVAVQTVNIPVTLVPSPTPLQISTPVLEPTITATPPPSDGTVSIGQMVQVHNTGGDGLRLRDQAGLAGNVVYLALDSEVFRVEEGPVEKDGFLWWRIVAENNDKQKGWAVENFLTGIR
jgi:hypothetical protein